MLPSTELTRCTDRLQPRRPLPSPQIGRCSNCGPRCRAMQRMDMLATRKRLPLRSSTILNHWAAPIRDLQAARSPKKKSRNIWGLAPVAKPPDTRPVRRRHSSASCTGFGIGKFRARPAGDTRHRSVPFIDEHLSDPPEEAARCPRASCRRVRKPRKGHVDPAEQLVCVL